MFTSDCPHLQIALLFPNPFHQCVFRILLTFPIPHSSPSITEAWFNTVSTPTVCDYCSTGDLYTYWQMIGQFTEDTVRVFAAELGCALGAYASTYSGYYSE